ncbi:MAG: SIR2 family protein [bacterium]
MIFKKFLHELNEGIKCKKTVVFCGAGISRSSGLPIVTELVPYILEKLGVTKAETETIMNAGLPFEAFIETLRENSDPNKIFDIFDLGEPNTNHFLLAKLAKAGYVTTICTTNFDRLIEKAFDAEGLVWGEHFRVFYKEDDLDSIDWQEKTIRLVKIHGSVEDRENMAITLGQVASQVLSSQRQGVIEHLFSTGAHKNVLVLGYSCSDVFDISPQVEAVRENHKKVVFVDHHRDQPRRMFFQRGKHTIKDLTDKEQKNPFRHFDDSKWVIFDTDELVKAVWNFCLIEKEFAFIEPAIKRTA